MRQGEFITGIGVADENGNKLTESKLAAAKGISQVVFSRIFMAFPGMSECRWWLLNHSKIIAKTGFHIFPEPIVEKMIKMKMKIYF